MSAYERGAGAAWDGGPPGAEADYAPPLPPAPAPRPAPTTDPWTGASYSQYPATYDYQAYPTGYPPAPYAYDPTYYQQPNQTAYYSNTRPPYPPLPTTSGYNYAPKYRESSRSPVRSRTPERKLKSYRSHSRSVSPYIKKERISPHVKKERISPHVKKERLSPYVKKERVSPHVKKERSVSPYIKKERSYSRTRDSSYEKESRKHRSQSRSVKSRTRKYSYSNHSSSRSRSRTPSLRKERLRKSVSSDSYSSDKSGKVSRTKSGKRSTSSVKKRSSSKHRPSSHTPSRSSSDSPVKKSSKEKKRSADTPPRKSRDTSLTPPQSYRSSKSSKSKGKRSVTPPKKYKSKERECLTPPRGYRSKESTSGSSKINKGRESSVTPPKSYARSRSSSNSRSPSTPPPRSKRKQSRSSSSNSRSSSRSSRSTSKHRIKQTRRSRSKTQTRSQSKCGSSTSKSNRRSKSPRKSRSPNSDDERRGQFTVADRKKYWKIHRSKHEDRIAKKSPVKEVKPPPDAVEKTQVDDVKYGVPPDIVGPNFADLLPSPAEVAALAAVATSSRSKGVPMPIKNDGSFLEMFKKMQEVAKKIEPETKKPEIKKPALPFIGKRRGGRVLKTGLVKKAKTIEEQTVDNTPKDAWSLYMQEVKKYRETSCEEECKTRPLVK